MRETDYAYAVAVIRSRENDLLTKSDYANLIRLPDYKENANFLETKGYKADYNSLNDTLNNKAVEVWDFLKQTVPDIKVFNFLILKNDFSNLKAVLKAKIMGLNEISNILNPCTIEPELLKETVYNKDFDLLPLFIRDCAEKAYDILARTQDSLLTDSFIDKCCLDSILDLSDKTNNGFIKNLAELNATYANIKIAYRMAKSNRSKEVIDNALCKANLIDRDMLLESSAQGAVELLNYLKTTDFKDITNILEKSIVLYEKEVDESQLRLFSNVKNNILGPEPIIAYYMAKEMEFLNIRIIMFCKHNGIDEESIRERVRDIV